MHPSIIVRIQFGITKSWASLIVRQVRTSSLVLVVLVLTGVFGSAQVSAGLNETTDSNMGGIHFIVGTVFGPSGKPVNVRMRLRLVSMTREVIASTDDAGRFVFSRISVGSYAIAVDREDGFEAVTHTVDVEPSRTPQTYSMSIRLREKKGSTTKPAVVNASSGAVPKRALELYKDAMKLSAAKDHIRAIDLLKQAIEVYPSYSDAMNEIGVQYMLTNDLPKADEVLVDAIRLAPKDFTPVINRAIVLFRQKKFADAEDLFNNAIKLKPGFALAHYYLGRCMTRLGRFEEAELELRKAIEIGGDGINEAHRMLADLFLEKGENQRAMEELKLYLELVPNASDAANLRKIIQQLAEVKTKG